MKPLLETLKVQDDQSSFDYFLVELPSLDPYWHYHPELEISYVSSGKGLRFVGDHIGAFKEGDLLFSGENLPHDRVSAEESNDLPKQVHVIQFSRNIFDDFPECAGLQELFKEAERGILFNRPEPNVVDQILALGKKSGVDRLIALLDILNKLAAHHDRQQLSSISYAKPPAIARYYSRMAKVSEHILKHFHEPLSLERISEFAGMTPPSFSRWFKKSFGKTFVNYLNTVRIERASQQLLESDWSIAQIAFDCGFESLSNFNRTFRSFKQTSPSAFRKRFLSVDG